MSTCPCPCCDKSNSNPNLTTCPCQCNKCRGHRRRYCTKHQLPIAARRKPTPYDSLMTVIKSPQAPKRKREEVSSSVLKPKRRRKTGVLIDRIYIFCINFIIVWLGVQIEQQTDTNILYFEDRVIFALIPGSVWISPNYQPSTGFISVCYHIIIYTTKPNSNFQRKVFVVTTYQGPDSTRPWFCQCPDFRDHYSTSSSRVGSHYECMHITMFKGINDFSTKHFISLIIFYVCRMCAVCWKSCRSTIRKTRPLCRRGFRE